MKLVRIGDDREVLGRLDMRSRDGKTIAMPLVDTSAASLQRAIHDNVEVGATLFTDVVLAYRPKSKRKKPRKRKKAKRR